MATCSVLFSDCTGRGNVGSLLRRLEAKPDVPEPQLLDAVGCIPGAVGGESLAGDQRWAAFATLVNFTDVRSPQRLAAC